MQPTRTALMTGASRGLGRHAAAYMLREHPDLHLVVTTRATSDGRLASDLAAASGNRNVSEVSCDLSSLDSVVSAACRVSELAKQGGVPPIDLLVANAGTQFTTTTRTSADGLEMTFAVNVLANFALIGTLAPAMTNPGRVVITSSDTHFGDFRHNLGMVAAPQWRDPALLSIPAKPGDANEGDGAAAYSTSKLGVIYLVHALARRLPTGLDVYSFNPSLVPGTGLARDRDVFSRMAWSVVLPIIRMTPLAMSAKKAGRLLAEAAIGPRPGESGTYIDRHRVTDSSAESYDLDREEQLWRTATTLMEQAPRTVS